MSQYVRYERFLQDIISNWPAPTVWYPENLSVETFARGLRNAIKSVIAFNFPIANIDIQKLAAIWPAATVYTYPGQVILAPKDSPKIVVDKAPTQVKSFVIPSTDSLAVKAALILLDRRHITLPVILQGNPQEAFDYITARELDVSIQPAPEMGEDFFQML